MPNFELMDATLKFLKARPVHNQKRWIEGNAIAMSGSELLDTTDDICGTTGCFAGWGSLIGGWHQLRKGFMQIDGKVIDRGSELVVDENGLVSEMTDAARESFGLSQDQAHCLFHSGNTIDEIEQMIDWLRDNPDNLPDHIGGPARNRAAGISLSCY